MKRINLIKRLLSYSHEKQSPQRFARYAAMLLMLLTLGVGQVWAGNTYTVYCVPEWIWGDDWSDSGTDWVRVNYQNETGKDDSWAQASMSKTELRYSGYDIYKATFDVWYDGVATLQFQRMTGGTNTVEATYGAISPWWGGSNWDGKLYNKSWIDLTYDKYTISAGTTIYFDNTETNWDDVNLHLVKHDYLGYDIYYHIDGTPYWYREYPTVWSNFGAAIFYQNGWGHQSGRIYDNIGSGVVCFTPNSSSDYSGFSTTAPVGPKNIAISNNGTTIVRGTGTESDPYVVAPGTTISVQASADKIDDNTTLYYKFSTGSSTSYSSSATTNTVVASAVAGTTYSVTATIKTMLSSNSSREFTTDPLYFTTGYPITFDMEGGTGGPSTMYAVYDKTLSGISSGSFPTNSGNGFDGFWTEDGGNGIQVINERGEWKANVAYYTGAGGKWLRTEATTLYARWLPTGYYVVGDFNNWTGDPAYHKFSGTPLTVSFEILKTNPELTNLRTPFKIRLVNAGSSSGSSNTWYGKNSAGEFGKSHTTETELNSSGDNLTLQVFYNGDYTFNLKTSPSVDLEVLVPVVNQLQIYTNSCDDTKDQYYNWDGEEADNKVTKTLALNRCDFYIKPVWDSYYYGKGTKGGGHTTIDRDHLSATGLGTGDSNEENLKLVADLKGNYTFKYDTVAKSIAVVFPTRYSVSYSVRTQRSGNGTESGANGSLTAVNTDDSNVYISTLSNYVVDGNKVLLTAPSAKSGYEFKGWYKGAHDASDWSTNQITENANCTITVNKDTAVYAVYYEPTYTIDIASSDAYSAGGGHVEMSSSPVTSATNVGVNSYAELTAVPTNEAWRFKTWQFTSNASLAGGYALTDKTVRVNATATSQTVTAVFEPRYGLVGSRKVDGDTKEGMPGWNNAESADFEIKSFTALNTDNGVDLECTRTLLPNRQYKFIVIDRAKSNARRGQENASDMPANTNWELSHGNDVYFWTSGYGDYTFHITKIGAASNYYPSLKIDYPSAHKLTLGWEDVTIDGTANTTSRTTYGRVTAETTESGNHYTITAGQYVADGGSITFTAAPTTGYTVEGWYTNNDYAVGHKISNGGNYAIGENTLTVSSISADLSIYAKFVETSTTVEFDHNAHGYITLDGVRSTRTTVGVTTTRALVAVPDEGYYFAGWSRSENPDFHLNGYAEANASATLTGDGAGRAGTLTANFVELNKVYFRNEFIDGSTVTHWENVYVYFNTSEESGCPKSNSSADFKKQMSLESGNVYWAYVPRSVTTTPYHNLAFSNHDYAVNTKLDGAGNECVRRGDYQAGLDMFVPQHSASETISNATYYKGYWKHHNAVKGVDAKYYMKRYTGGTSYVDADDGAGNNHFSVFDENTIVYSLRIDNMTDAHNRYRIDPQYGDVWYITNNGSAAISGDTVKTTHCDNLPMTEYTSSTPTFVISPSSEGMYAITIDMSGDVMRMSVNYPIAVGDYRLKHTYTYGSSKTCYSDIIKSNATYPLTVSMYIAAEDGSDVDTNIDGTMVLEKCTNLDGGKPVFGSSTDVSAYSLATFDKGKGVYQFDITVANNAVSKVENVKLYDGVYYVKADSLPGNWANYKLNVMGQNTINYDKENSKTFDYYYCHWYGNRNGQYNTNVKCIIANEYNNQLSDTLKGDDVLGAEVQTLPHPANVRFSYNSYTNEIKRTYINGSEKYHDKFLFLEGTEKVNANGSGGHSNKLTDENNWIYQLDIKAQETARVRLTAMYGNNDASGLVQELIGSKTGDVSESNTVEILGGNSSATDWHDLRIIYDFKTNFLLAAWLASTDQTIDKVEALNTNVMILRQDQGDAKQITINTGKSLTEVDTVYTAFSFTKAHLTTAGNEYARKYYWVSFPYAVKISDVFGSMGEYAKDWVLREYDGKGRAENGFWAESASNWKFITDKNKVLTPYQGYLLQLSLPKYTANGGKWVNNVTKLTLYFPSNSSVGSIVQKNVNATLGTGNPSDYYCSINRTVQADGETPTGLPNEYDRRVRDSYWHCIGAPSFANETNTSFNAHNGETTGDGATWIADKLPFLYTWNSTTNELTATSSSGEFKFMALKAYLVQCNAESISWTNVSVPSSAVAARRAPGAEDIHFAEFNLNILRNEESLDHTYVRLTDKEDVTADFEFGHDLCKEFKSGANIYTLIDQLEVAGNSLPLNLNTTTIVPVGVKIAADGQYTFAMPEGTNGIGVTLIDNVAGTRTNLGLTDYTVDLTAGKHDTRFMLEISPIANTPTNIESAGEGLHDTGTRKVMMDGKLYIIKEGYVFDARGAKVK